MFNKKVLASLALATITLTQVAPVMAGGLVKYNEKTVYNTEVANEDGTMKDAYKLAIKCTPDTFGAKLYSTYSYDLVDAEKFVEVDKNTYDKEKRAELKKTEADGFTDWKEVDVNSKELADAKKLGNDFWKVETSEKDNDKTIDKANALPVFDKNGVVYNYIAKEEVVLNNHTRGNAMAGSLVTVNGHIDGTTDTLNAKDFDSKWNAIGKKYGTQVTQKDLDKLAYNYANKYMRLLTDDGSDQAVRYGDAPIYYYTGSEDINFTGVWGVLIAPNANVKVNSCNWCGTIIAKNIISDGEAHLWSWNGKKVNEEHYFVRDAKVKYFVTEYKHFEENEYCVITKDTTPETGDTIIDLIAASVGTVIVVAGALVGRKIKSRSLRK